MLRLARTMTMYIWNLGTKKVPEIGQMTLVDVVVLSFIRVDYQVQGVGLAR